MKKNCTVTITKPPAPARAWTVRRGLGFQALCAKHDTPIEFGCRNADCGVCIFRVVRGMENLAPRNAKETDFLRAMQADHDERLACQSRIMGDVEIVIDAD